MVFAEKRPMAAFLYLVQDDFCICILQLPYITTKSNVITFSFGLLCHISFATSLSDAVYMQLSLYTS